MHVCTVSTYEPGDIRKVPAGVHTMLITNKLKVTFSGIGNTPPLSQNPPIYLGIYLDPL